MDFDYSSDEEEIRQHARRVLAKACPASLVRAMIDGEAGLDAPLWRIVCEQGWTGVALEAEYGGSGLEPTALCALAEETGRALAPLPFLPSLYLFAPALQRFGSGEQKRRWLPSIASGEVVGSAFLGEGATVQDGRLDGVVLPVPYGLTAGAAVVAARSDAQTTVLCLVDLEGGGVERNSLRTIDDSRPQAAITFHNTPAELLGEPAQGSAIIARLLSSAAVFVAFEQLGGADASLAQARDYALERRSFGRPIGSYQAIKHLLADVYAANELARSNAYYAAWALSADAPELPLAAATARVSATEAYEFASRENIQVHGGMGFTWEADPHLHYRRAQALGLALGPVGAWRDRLVSALDAAGKV